MDWDKLLEMNGGGVGPDADVQKAYGLSKNPADRKQNERFKFRFLLLALTLVAGICLSFYQALHWDKYALEVMGLQTKQFLGASSLDDMERMAEICEERLKPDCMKTMYQQMIQRNPDDPEGYAKVARAFRANGELPQAAQSYATYFSKGGLDFDAAYDYARTLDKLGRNAEASEYYRYLLEAKPEMIQVTVLKNLIDMLMKQGQYKEVKEVIKDLHAKGGNAENFFNLELKRAESKIALNKNVAGQ